jgi:hypothetical protein
MVLTALCLIGCTSYVEKPKPAGNLSPDQQKVWDQAVERQRAAQEAAAKKQAEATTHSLADADISEAKYQELSKRAAHGFCGIVLSVRNPTSTRLETAYATADGTICYIFRSQNGFGGMNRERAVFPATSEKFNVSTAGWKKYCTKKAVADVTSNAALLTGCN